MIKIHRHRAWRIHLVLLVILLAAPSTLLAKKLRTENVTILYKDTVQLEQFNRKAHRSGLAENWSDSGSPEATAGLHVGRMISRIKGLLDLYPERLQFNLALFDRTAELQQVYRILYDQDTDFISFYSPRTETVYISLEDLRSTIVIHEITHAIVHQYYDRPTSVAVHELLAQYVEGRF